MGISKEFDGATLQDDGRVRIDGTSTVDGKATADPAGAQIYVAIRGLEDEDKNLRVEIATHDDARWSAFFEGAVPPLRRGEELDLIGLALCPGRHPIAWVEEGKPLAKK